MRSYLFSAKTNNLIKKHKTTQGKKLARLQNISQEDITELLDCKIKDITYILAGRRDLSPTHKQTIIKSPYKSAQQNLAFNRDLTKEELLNLYNLN